MLLTQSHLIRPTQPVLPNHYPLTTHIDIEIKIDIHMMTMTRYLTAMTNPLSALPRAPMRLVRYLTVLIVAVILAGCETVGIGPNAGVDSRLTQDDQPRFFSKSGTQACLAGASIGALGCLLSGTDNMAACMAIAAAAGCGAGAGANYVLDSRRAQFANNEQRMNAYIEDVEADSAKLRARIITVRSVLSDNQRQLTQIQQDILTKTGDERARQQQLAQMRANQRYLNNELADLNKKIELYRDVAMRESTTGVQSPVFLSKLRGLEAERDDLQRLIERTYQDLPSLVAAR